jgi:hypothetical protein
MRVHIRLPRLHKNVSDFKECCFMVQLTLGILYNLEDKA